MREPTFVALGVLSFVSFGGACDGATPTSRLAPTTVEESRPRSEPIEFIGVSVERPIDAAGFVALVGPLFGEAAERGQGHRDFELDPGLRLTSGVDPRTARQAIISLELETTVRTTADRRVILRAPATYELGRVFIDTVLAALARADEENGHRAGSMSPFELEHTVFSAKGGMLRIVVKHREGATTLRFETENPRTSLEAARVNTIALAGDPWERVGGTVWFGLSRDEFQFFSDRAYGSSAAAAQNFRDFRLVPHDWLRLTVTPEPDAKLIHVGFDVVTRDGRRIAFAEAPASTIAGEQFQQTVLRMIANMEAQEARAPGSSTSFEVPFHYDDPEGGGVVRVVATGSRGRFEIAYAVQSPLHRLSDVDEVTYVARPTPTTTPRAMTPTTCEAVGSRDALRGHFRMRFDASDTVRSRAGALRGTLHGSVFRASDVTITGPNEGAVSVADFRLDDVDLSDRAALPEHVLDSDLPAGDYQVLAFLDTDGDRGDEPTEGDPVTLPIGAYGLRCDMQPITVELALRLPPGR